METKVTSTVVKGIVISLVLITLSIVGQIADLDTQSWFKWLSVLLLFAAIIGSCILYANQNNHNVTFGNTFADGFKTTAVITCLTIVFIIVLFLVMPELKQRALDQAMLEVEKGGQSDEAMEKAAGFVKSMFFPFLIGGIMVTYLFIGALAALIGAAVAKKQPRDPFQQPLQ